MEEKEVNHRLEQIEIKVDRLNSVLVSQARAEEKIGYLETTIPLILEKLEKMDLRSREFEKKTDQTEQRVAGISKFFWMVVTTVITVGIGTILMYPSTK